MKRVSIIIVSFMLAFSVSFINVFSSIRTIADSFHSALKVVDTLIPGLNFTSFSSDTSLYTDPDGFYKFNNLNVDLNLPSSLNWRNTALYSVQNVHDWINYNVLPYTTTDNVDYSFSTFGFEYSKKGVGWVAPEVKSLSLYPTVYSATFNANPSYSTDTYGLAFAEDGGDNTILFLRLTVTFLCEDNNWFSGNILSSNVYSVFLPFYRKVFSNGKDVVSVDVLIPFNGYFNYIYTPIPAPSEPPYYYSRRAFWIVKSFGYDVNISSSNDFYNDLPADFVDLVGLKDTGIPIVDFLRSYSSNFISS